MLIKEFSHLLYRYDTVVIFDWGRFVVLWKGLAKDIPLVYAQEEVQYVYSDMYGNKNVLVIVV